MRRFIVLFLVVLFAFAIASDRPRAQGAAVGALEGPELETALIGKVFGIRTEKMIIGPPDNPTGTTRRTDGGHTRFELAIRSDNSLIFTCTFHDRGGSSMPCRGSSRDAGIWSVRGNRFCTQYLTVRGSQEQCYTVYRDGADLRLAQISGPPSTVDGERLVRK